MHRSISNPALLRSIITGVVVLAGSSACSRPDRAGDGDSTNQPAAAATAADTQATATAASDTNAAARPNETAATPRGDTAATDQGVSGYQPMARDTLQKDTASALRAPDDTDTVADDTDTVAVGDSAQIGKPGERLEGTQASEQANEDTLENQSDSARIRPPEDSSETSGAAVGSSEMARDTSVDVAQGDTAVQADTVTEIGAADTTTVLAEGDTSTTAQAREADSSAIWVSVDTTTAQQQTEVAVENPAGVGGDTAVVVGDSTEASQTGERLEPEVVTAEANTDTLATEEERVRPPEDSTEILGNVTTDEPSAETDEVESRDAAVAAAAGVESTGNAVTGANAVSEMTRQGQECVVVTGSEDVRWDMALSPATLNPCGTGTMTLPKIVTGEE